MKIVSSRTIKIGQKDRRMNENLHFLSSRRSQKFFMAAEISYLEKVRAVASLMMAKS